MLVNISLQLYVKCAIIFIMRLWFQTFVSRMKTILEYDNCQVEVKMEVVCLGSMHVHMREKFENDPCRQHYEKVYTACSIHPDTAKNPVKFYMTILSEAVRNLQDPDYKNYRYKFISRRFSGGVSPEKFKEHLENVLNLMETPEFGKSYLVANTINHGVVVPCTLDSLMKEFEKSLQTGEWGGNTSFSFSIVSDIKN